MHFLAICGSLRNESLNAATLAAAGMVAPGFVHYSCYDGLGALPFYSPDLRNDPPSAVQALRARVNAADALLIATTQYAHGVPGALKNAIDWLADGGDLAGKPVGVLATSPCDGWAHSLLCDMLRAMCAQLVDTASPVLLPQRRPHGRAFEADADLLCQLQAVMGALAREVRKQRRSPPHDPASATSAPPGPRSTGWSLDSGHRALPESPRAACPIAE
jgi:hypothetical protein